jgi:phenylpyruvate tautomerase PptA (4-oxalocrotonate tautomerase family)
MPMIDVYAPAGTFADAHQLATDLARTLMEVEQVPDIALFRTNTAAFVHDMPATAYANVDGASDHIRITVLTNAGALDRDKQLAAVRRLTDVAAEAASDPSLAERTWVQLTEAIEGGWGLGGTAYTNAELVGLARQQLGA